uniref:Partner of bursicon n=1 Tax=Strigamia maritima TaxID=126957 RepID=T1JIJ4_STRMM
MTNTWSAFAFFTIITFVLFITTKSLRAFPESTCETLPSFIHIIKEEYDSRTKLVRTCEGDVAVNKCEGTCTSQMQPSVTTSTGFLKECYCCRESYLQEREVILQRCFNFDGETLAGDMSLMKIRLKEPAECQCYKCGE